MFKSVDRILLAHRNLKLVLFCTTGPFFVLFTAFKYTIKFLVLYVLYKNKKKKDENVNLSSMILGNHSLPSIGSNKQNQQ